jgi:hypothetical protein
MEGRGMRAANPLNRIWVPKTNGGKDETDGFRKKIPNYCTSIETKKPLVNEGLFDFQSRLKN